MMSEKAIPGTHTVEELRFAANSPLCENLPSVDHELMRWAADVIDAMGDALSRYVAADGDSEESEDDLNKTSRVALAMVGLLFSLK